MKTRKWMIPLGMVAVLSFISLEIFGILLWPGYNPIHNYISDLISDRAPHVHLMRTFMNIYAICLCLFTLAVSVHAFRTCHICLKVGYTLLFVLAFISVLGYSTVPIGVKYIFSLNNIIHLVLTITFLCLTIIALVLITFGYLKQERLFTMGKIALVTTTLFILFNLWHIIAILSGQNILGLIERLTFYSFQAFIFSTSWIYTFKYRVAKTDTNNFKKTV